MDIFSFSVYAWIGIALLTLVALLLFKIRAPYGRHVSPGWGPRIDNKWGWVIMEFPALIVFPLLALGGPSEKNGLTYLLVALWVLHYFHRTLIFPFRLRTRGKKMPLIIVFSAIFFNLINGFLNGYYLGYCYDGDPHFSIYTSHIVLGFLLFASGMFINYRADRHLIALRKTQDGYQIPRGGLFEYISCPNHFGEIIEWTGFAIMAWNLPALSFAIWTFCNLVPRAINHHQWYLEHFEDYPASRKAVIPFVAIQKWFGK